MERAIALILSENVEVDLMRVKVDIKNSPLTDNGIVRCVAIMGDRILIDRNIDKEEHGRNK
jgi:hypothetical protein